jgi:hypothetical protein
LSDGSREIRIISASSETRELRMRCKEEDLKTVLSEMLDTDAMLLNIKNNKRLAYHKRITNRGIDCYEE